MDKKNQKILINLSILLAVAFVLFFVVSKGFMVGEKNFLNLNNNGNSVNIDFKIKNFKKFNLRVLDDPNFKNLHDNTNLMLQNNRKLIGNSNPFVAKTNN